ncbi:unnamed protein product, partial [Effrenium voratum]
KQIGSQGRWFESECCTLMARKRRETIAPESKRQKLTDKPGPRYAPLAQAIAKANLPDECAAMLVEAVPVTLGVPAQERDKRQLAVAGFIGEVVKDLEAELLRKMLETKQDSFEESVASARGQLEGAEEQLALRLSEEEAARVAYQAATQRAAEAEATRSADEARLLAASLERDLCRTACAALQDSQTQSSAIEHKAISKVCAKLNLEDSLLSTLPLILKSAESSRSYLEKAAAKLIAEALEKHCAALEELCSEQATSGTEDATREAQAGRDKQEIAQRAQANAAELVKQAEVETGHFRHRLLQAQSAETQALAKLQDVNPAGGIAGDALRQLRKGALATYYSLDGPDVNSQAVECLEQQLLQLESCKLSRCKAEFDAHTRNPQGAEGEPVQNVSGVITALESAQGRSQTGETGNLENGANQSTLEAREMEKDALQVADVEMQAGETWAQPEAENLKGSTPLKQEELAPETSNAPVEGQIQSVPEVQEEDMATPEVKDVNEALQEEAPEGIMAQPESEGSPERKRDQAQEEELTQPEQVEATQAEKPQDIEAERAPGMANEDNTLDVTHIPDAAQDGMAATLTEQTEPSDPNQVSSANETQMDGETAQTEATCCSSPSWMQPEKNEATAEATQVCADEAPVSVGFGGEAAA